MKRKVEFSLDDGSSVIVEVDEPETEGTIRASRVGDRGVERARISFKEALRKIYDATENAIIPLTRLSMRPSEIEMEFGINFNAEMGAIISSSTSEANYKITLRWTKELS